MAHRAAHIASPMFVGSTAYYGGDRLIWAMDIALVARVFDETDWAGLCDMARERRIARVCLDGLKLAGERLGAPVPPEVVAALEAMPGKQHNSAYLLTAPPLSRALRDLRAVRGWRSRLAFLARRVFPARAVIRAKYPAMGGYPIVSLYFRRFAETLRKRPPRSQH